MSVHCYYCEKRVNKDTGKIVYLSESEFSIEDFHWVCHDCYERKV